MDGSQSTAHNSDVVVAEALKALKALSGKYQRACLAQPWPWSEYGDAIITGQRVAIHVGGMLLPKGGGLRTIICRQFRRRWRRDEAAPIDIKRGLALIRATST